MITQAAMKVLAEHIGQVVTVSYVRNGAPRIDKGVLEAVSPFGSVSIAGHSPFPLLSDRLAIKRITVTRGGQAIYDNPEITNHYGSAAEDVASWEAKCFHRRP